MKGRSLSRAGTSRLREPLDILDEIPAFAGASPSALGIAEVSERIENGVDIRADPQTQVFEVVAT